MFLHREFISTKEKEVLKIKGMYLCFGIMLPTLFEANLSFAASQQCNEVTSPGYITFVIAVERELVIVAYAFLLVRVLRPC